MTDMTDKTFCKKCGLEKAEAESMCRRCGETKNFVTLKEAEWRPIAREIELVNRHQAGRICLEGKTPTLTEPETDEASETLLKLAKMPAAELEKYLLEHGEPEPLKETNDKELKMPTSEPLPNHVVPRERPLREWIKKHTKR